MIGALVERTLSRVRIDEVMAHLTRLTEHDRYQASLGIERAADVIASAAQAIGLSSVTIDRFAADGAKQWWTFQAPRAWTPITARLEMPGVVTLDHSVQPFTIATYSAPTPPAGLVARVVRGDQEVAGAIAVIGATTSVAELADRGAVGFITDGPSRGEHPGRIELDARTSLFGFSVTSSQRAAIEAVAGAEAKVLIDIDRSARMPVVTGVVPGRAAGEVWLTSHLCHPRPGANDNASGAAALLGVAAIVADAKLDRSIRFVWGPEFLGVAALLHQVGRDRRPLAVINLDMVGEDPMQCGVPLVVERAPDWCASVITPLAEHVVEQVFAQTSAHPGTWRPGPFLGYSDHALFANFRDPDWRSPAVQLWHPGDPFNHTAADTLDKVSPMEMRRAIAAGAVLAEVLAGDDACSRGELEQIVQRWCDREEAAAGAWLVDHVRGQGAMMRALVAGGPAAWRAPRRPDHGAFAGRWPGPFNYRALLAELSPASRSAVTALFLADKRNYAVLTHLAMLAELCGSRDEAIAAASLALRAPIDPAAGRRLWSALLESGWIEEASRG